MKHLHDGALLAYPEAGPAAPDYEAIRAHLTVCAACRARLEALRAERDRVSRALAALEPGPLDAPHAQRALASIRETVSRKESETMIGKLKNNRQLQRAAAIAAAVVVLAGLLALPPVRALASDFLALFRVEHFVVVNADSERMEQIVRALDENMFFGEQEVIEEMAEPMPAASLEEAAALAGFTPRAPQGYGEPARIEVAGGGHVRYTPEVEALRAVFEAVGLDPALLPDSINGKPFDITIPLGVALTYDDGDPDTHQDFTVMQVPSPVVEVPEGIDMQALGEAMLQLIGMSPQEAARLSRSIDWTTTLVVPVPTDIASVREVQVDGTIGLLFDAAGYDPSAAGALLWQKDGIVTMIAGSSSSMRLLAVAESLE
jgi:hypothetical protein